MVSGVQGLSPKKPYETWTMDTETQKRKIVLRAKIIKVHKGFVWALN